jgi:hypothetical protein
LADSDAVEVPGLVGIWGRGDTALFEVRQVADRPRTYVAATVNRILDGDARPDTIAAMWFDVRVGRLAGRMVAEAAPSTHSDTALGRMIQNYGLVRRTHVVGVFELRRDTLQVLGISDDSASAVLARNQCNGPFVRWNYNLELTGTAEQVRSSYECLLRQPGILRQDYPPMHRMQPH